MDTIDYTGLFSQLGFTTDEVNKLVASMKRGAVRHCGALAMAGAVGIGAMAFSSSMQGGGGFPDKRMAVITGLGGGAIGGGLLFTACMSIKRKIEKEIFAAVKNPNGLPGSAILAKMSQAQKESVTNTAKELLRLDVPIEERLEEDRRQRQREAVTA